MTQILILILASLILVETSYLAYRALRPAIGKRARTILVDTSVLMDGRILEIAETGFIGGTLLIPRSVLGELQLLADGSSSDKRERARAGLDLVAELQQVENLNVRIHHDNRDAREGVDNRLLKLANATGSSLCTLDFNLSKVAVVEGVEVLNINTLAQSVRAAFLPGDKLKISLVQKGQESGQAIGYLPDGTMVVVDHAVGQVGSEVEIEVIRSLQTAAGRMMFAKRTTRDGTGTGTKKTHAKPAGHKPQPKLQPKPQSEPKAPRADTKVATNSNAKRPATTASADKTSPKLSTKPSTKSSNHRRSSSRAESDLVKLANR